MKIHVLLSQLPLWKDRLEVEENANFSMWRKTFLDTGVKRNLAFQLPWRQKSAELFWRLFLLQKALKLKHRIVILLLFIQMVSMIQPWSQYLLWFGYKRNDGIGILVLLDKLAPSMTKSATGVCILYATAFLCAGRFPSLFLSEPKSSISWLSKIIYAFPVKPQSLLIQTKQ